MVVFEWVWVGFEGWKDGFVAENSVVGGFWVVDKMIYGWFWFVES